ncbi:MAG: site-specific DNA-methyltransferase [Candidatus Glassbacteria bacterium]|nr:site-specific DNA-methyltransferase [Candidatus Glassbacteria bacterium]
MSISNLKYDQSTLPNNSNKLEPNDRAIHDWYRFVLSFPPHLVRHYIDRFELTDGDTLLDPFCGTGTTLVEAKKNGISSIGIEANPMAHFASKVKINWDINARPLQEHAYTIAEKVKHDLANQNMRDDVLPEECLFEIGHDTNRDLYSLTQEEEKLILKNSISPIPLHKSLLLLRAIQSSPKNDFVAHELIAFVKMLVESASNLHFGPEVGVRKAKKDALVAPSWLNNVNNISKDLEAYAGSKAVLSDVILSDSRHIGKHLDKESIKAVFTSPPYPNEKDYSRTTRLESVMLGFIKNKQELREMKKTFIRSNTRGVYKEDKDDQWIKNFTIINEIAAIIEKRRIEQGKTSGFEKLYSRVTKLYFGGMAKHLAELRVFLKKGAYLGYVVGDQASYLRVFIPTGQILAEIAESLGYEVVSIDLFRTRFASATKMNMREEVLVLRWP